MSERVVSAAPTGADADWSVDRGAAAVPHSVSARLPILVAAVVLLAVMLLGIAVGPVGISFGDLVSMLLARIPLLHFHSHASALDQTIVWQLRMPRVVLAGLVGSMLAAGGTAYQGVFRNPLADPYLLGVAAGAGLGATMVIVSGHNTSLVLPVAAFLGGVAAVAMTYLVGVAGDRRSSGRSIVLAGVAVAALLTAIQTYLQQQHTQQIQQIYNWILGSLSVGSWSDVRLILPYVIISGTVLLTHRRILDVLRVGPDEAATLGIHPERTRLVIVAAATLGTAAAVSVSGLIGFVGIIVPHTVRLASSASYRVLMPVSMIGGAAFLVLADLLARTVEAPGEVPIGVVTAIIGAPFFLFVLRSRRSRQGVL
ncbi:MAG: iron ABC transporter permease [Actinomycetota bacterium]|nr:iron ABC transporter permease [Actinomycetota bacterium]